MQVLPLLQIPEDCPQKPSCGAERLCQIDGDIFQFGAEVLGGVKLYRGVPGCQEWPAAAVLTLAEKLELVFLR